ncbi:NADH-quinone oxidoreductase subunit NuoF [Salinispira pacifica]
MIEARPLTEAIRADGVALSIDEYEKAGGYAAARKMLKEMSPEQVVSSVKDAGLMGRGGAGFLTGLKWSLVAPESDSPGPRFLIANGDEMEPGTFKDRYLMERNPHQLIEGMICASYAIRATDAYVFIRDHYYDAQEQVARAIAEAYRKGYLGSHIFGSDYSLEMRIHGSAGRYICGEETALISALEGGRPVPRSKPPFPGVAGLFGRPTVVNNVETLCNVPHIVANGPVWFRDLSRTAQGGTKIFGVSGKVKKPGLWELPMGTTIRETIFEHAGGMLNGHSFRGVLPGGGSTDFLVEEHLDVPMDYEHIQQAGSRFGTATMIVLDDHACPVGFVANLMKFFAQQSCGWCTPCREGLPWLARILFKLERGEGSEEDVEILSEHTSKIWLGKTYCALAPGAIEPLQSALKYFRDDFMRHVHDKRCPWS